ncbi:hypothetical protein PMKS-001277 [Pichia membranifaciens]|uniref:Very-long-chain 3-oxoacyl-CoA reductase n=1 Tax=Pichia membranifaciens TaxID=4926 RepID=A0A1Q2YE41_9ASCO|nr:hypothetical protein PMKS-001277 [Pichia membranifaciens]
MKITRVVAPVIVANVGKATKLRGLILTMGSFAGLVPSPLLCVYSGSKAFLQNWSTSLAGELKPEGVDVELVISYLVTSAMSKIRRASFTIPNPQRFNKRGRSGQDSAVSAAAARKVDEHGGQRFRQAREDWRRYLRGGVQGDRHETQQPDRGSQEDPARVRGRGDPVDDDQRDLVVEGAQRPQHRGALRHCALEFEQDLLGVRVSRHGLQEVHGVDSGRPGHEQKHGQEVHGAAREGHLLLPLAQGLA